LQFRVAIDYSARDEMARAAAQATAAFFHERPLSAEVMKYTLTQALTAEWGDVDLLIRSGGEQRLSDFLLWESAYAEFVFTDRLWPDFDEADLEAALEDFRRRERRFGGVQEPAVSTH
jgi:undecaprenyl diphosphate synthase